MLTAFLDFLFPPACPVCGARVSAHGQMCAVCWNRFDWISAPMCAKCGYPFPANLERGGKLLCPNCIAKKTKLDWMRTACVYDDASRGIMLPFKHGARLEYRDIMARAMIPLLHELPECGPQADADAIILPVPLAWRRLWRRGYNQAALLARPIAKHLGAKIDHDSVRRKHCADMGHKNARQRAENVRGVFKVLRPGRIRGRRILLVDDVFTTGATFNELAKVLKRAGAVWVGGITFCRAVRAI
jgi:ComF family protein